MITIGSWISSEGVNGRGISAADQPSSKIPGVHFKILNIFAPVNFNQYPQLLSRYPFCPFDINPRKPQRLYVSD